MPSQLIQGVESRYALYELDAPARSAIKELWPVIAPVLDQAGAAGKGFGVVASEVKALANQTTRATDEISQQVPAIQEATRKSVDEISSIARAIEQLTIAATSIASAVEQQSTTTRSIAGSIQTAAGNTASASAEIQSVERRSQRDRIQRNRRFDGAGIGAGER